MARKSLSKKLRFDVFKRDSFVCQYCGGTPPSIVLEVDHIDPVVNGGKDSIDNLLTSCFDCNRGKGGGLLTSIPETIQKKADRIAEQEEQIKAFNRLLANKRRRENSHIDKIEEVFKEIYENLQFTDVFRESIRSNFLPYIPLEVLITAMSKAVSVAKDSGGSIKYFCGICWNIRKSGQ